MWGRSASQLAGAAQGREKERRSLQAWAPPEPGVGWAGCEAGAGQAAPHGGREEEGPTSSVARCSPSISLPALMSLSAAVFISDNKDRKPPACLLA